MDPFYEMSNLARQPLDDFIFHIPVRRPDEPVVERAMAFHRSDTRMQYGVWMRNPELAGEQIRLQADAESSQQAITHSENALRQTQLPAAPQQPPTTTYQQDGARRGTTRLSVPPAGASRASASVGFPQPSRSFGTQPQSARTFSPSPAPAGFDRAQIPAQPQSTPITTSDMTAQERATTSISEQLARERAQQRRDPAFQQLQQGGVGGAPIPSALDARQATSTHQILSPQIPRQDGLGHASIQSASSSSQASQAPPTNSASQGSPLVQHAPSPTTRYDSPAQGFLQEGFGRASASPALSNGHITPARPTASLLTPAQALLTGVGPYQQTSGHPNATPFTPQSSTSSMSPQAAASADDLRTEIGPNAGQPVSSDVQNVVNRVNAVRTAGAGPATHAKREGLKELKDDFSSRGILKPTSPLFEWRWDTKLFDQDVWGFLLFQPSRLASPDPTTSGPTQHPVAPTTIPHQVQSFSAAPTTMPTAMLSQASQPTVTQDEERRAKPGPNVGHPIPSNIQTLADRITSLSNGKQTGHPQRIHLRDLKDDFFSHGTLRPKSVLFDWRWDTRLFTTAVWEWLLLQRNYAKTSTPTYMHSAAQPQQMQQPQQGGTVAGPSFSFGTGAASGAGQQMQASQQPRGVGNEREDFVNWNVVAEEQARVDARYMQQPRDEGKGGE